MRSCTWICMCSWFMTNESENISVYVWPFCQYMLIGSTGQCSQRQAIIIESSNATELFSEPVFWAQVLKLKLLPSLAPVDEEMTPGSVVWWSLHIAVFAKKRGDWNIIMECILHSVLCCKRSDLGGNIVPFFGSLRNVLWELRRIDGCYPLSFMRKETRRLKVIGSQ